MKKNNITPRGMMCLTAVLIVILAGIPRPASAEKERDSLFDETELMFVGEDLYTVSIASRKAEPLQRAPAAVTVIQADELKNYRTLSDVLRRVPGFFIDRNELKERIYLRGVADSFLVMMDGVPFANDASTIDYPRGHELSLDYIQKIEIIRGPGSALWGPDAYSGIVNLVTRKGEDIQGAGLSLETGSYDTRGTSAQAGFAKKGWDGFLFGSYLQTEGFEHDLPGERRRRDDHFGEIYARLSYKDFFEISARYSRYRDYYSDTVFLLEGSEHKAFSFIQATLNKSLEHSSFSAQGWFQYFDSLDDYDTSRYEQHNRQFGFEVKYDRTFFGNNFATLGASLRYNDGSTIKFKYRDNSFDYFPDYDNSLVSLYFQDKWKISDSLEATFGIRYDNHSEYKRFFSPRLGLNYIFFDYFSIKLLYGRAFRTPSLIVLMEERSLDPEQIDSLEAELGFRYKNMFSITCNYFYNDFTDLIERNALGEVTNSDDETIKGIEVSLNWKPHKVVSLYANYSHLFGDRQKGSRATRSVPSEQDPNETIESTVESFFNVAADNIFNCGIDLSANRYLRFNLEMNYVDARKLSRNDGDSTSLRRISSYVLFNANVFVRDFPLDNVELALRLRNLGDKEYETRGVFGLVDGEGSSVYITLSYTF